MELVYLWVDNYKNIEKQGFNFSPRFECSYDGKNLTIKEKEDYINIFPENINVTAIVGENGSGKSSILEIFANILNRESLENINNFIYILFDRDDKFKCFTYEVEVKKLMINNQNIEITKEDIVQKEKIELTNHFYMAYMNISHLSRDNIIWNDVPSPEDKIYYLGIYGKNNFASHTSGRYEEFDLKRFFLEFYELIPELFNFERYRDTIENLNINSIKYIKVDILNGYEAKSHDEVEYIEYCEKNNHKFDITNKEVIKELVTKTLKNFPKDYSKNNNPVELKFVNENDEVITLSSGEIVILFHLERIARLLMLFIQKKDLNKSKPIIFLLDEIELYLHPNWQKKIIKILINFFKVEKDFKFHILLTSHSPFILSDLPKENVIFLEKGKQVYPFKDKQTFGTNIHTLLSHGFFMSDGLMGEFAKGKIEKIKDFYDENKDLKKDDTNFQSKKDEFEDKKKDFENIHKIIGEPFLKTVIGNYLDELHLIFSDDKTLIQKELDAIEKRKKKLERLRDAKA